MNMTDKSGVIMNESIVNNRLRQLHFQSTGAEGLMVLPPAKDDEHWSLAGIKLNTFWVISLDFLTT